LVVKEPACHNPGVPARRIVVLLIAVMAAGCYWLRYHDLVLTHCELIEDLSTATQAQTDASPPRIEPGDVERLRYPLGRAREFIEIAATRYADRESLVELTALVGVYAELIGSLERMRVGVADSETIRALVADIHEHAERVRDAVARESA